MKDKLKRYKAFSLVEILWAVAILSIIIVIVTGVFTGLLLSSKKNNKFVTATGLAEKQIEYIKLLSSSDIPLDCVYDGAVQEGDNMHDNVYFPPYPQPAFLRENVDGIMYYYKIETSYVPDTGNKVINIAITVYWDVSKNEGKIMLPLCYIKRYKINGLTLLELVMAILLFSLFLLGAFGIFSFGLKNWRLMETKNDARMQALVAMTRMTKDLKSTDMSSLIIGPPEEEYIAFETAFSDPASLDPIFHKNGDYPEWQGYILYYTYPRTLNAVDKVLLRKFVPHPPGTVAKELTDISLYLVDTVNPGEDLKIVARNIYDLEFSNENNDFIIDISLATRKSFTEKRLAYQKDFTGDPATELVIIKSSVIPRNTP